MALGAKAMSATRKVYTRHDLCMNPFIPMWIEIQAWNLLGLDTKGKKEVVWYEDKPNLSWVLEVK
jgi:hypothetical protein